MSEQEKRLSYQYSGWNMLGNIIVACIFCSSFYIKNSEGGFRLDFRYILTGVFAIVFLAKVISQVLYLCTAYVRADKLVFKKYLRAEKTYTAKQIVKVKKYNLGKINYVLVTMRDSHGMDEKYLVVNIYTWYIKSKYDAEEVLTELQQGAGKSAPLG